MYNKKEMKETLKRNAQEIKDLRKLVKETQRTGGSGSAWSEQSSLHFKVMDYRHLHIAYSILKGKCYSQIEPKVRPGNKPNWAKIQAYQDSFFIEEIA